MTPTHARIAVAALAILAAPLARAQTGGAYDLTWNTLSSGGQTFATGGAYQLGGTLGQPDAGYLAGGAYALDGGFWSGAAPHTTGVESGGDAIPKVFAARLAGPNPFRSSTAIHFELPEARRVSLVVFGVDGRVAARVLDGERGAGRHKVFWDGAGSDGRALPAGMYFARLTAGPSRSTFRIVRIH